jgi:hypothetical protein
LLREPTTSPTCLPVEQPTQPSSSPPFRALPLLLLALLQLNCAPAVPRGADPQHHVQQLVRPRAAALLIISLGRTMCLQAIMHAQLMRGLTVLCCNVQCCPVQVWPHGRHIDGLPAGGRRRRAAAKRSAEVGCEELGLACMMTGMLLDHVNVSFLAAISPDHHPSPPSHPAWCAVKASG